MFGRRAHRGRQREFRLLAAPQLWGHRHEVFGGLVLVGATVEVGAQSRRVGHGRGVFEAKHHVADRPVADVGDRPGDGHHRLAGSGGDLRGDLIDPHLNEGDRAGFARGGGGQHRTGSQDADDRQQAQQGRPPGSRRRRTAVNPRERVVPQPRFALHRRRRLRPGTATVLAASGGLVGPTDPGPGMGLRTLPR